MIGSGQALPAAGGYRETGSPFYSAALLAAVASSLEIALA
jgi:hypothetical protein